MIFARNNYMQIQIVRSCQSIENYETQGVRQSTRNYATKGNRALKICDPSRLLE